VEPWSFSFNPANRRRWPLITWFSWPRFFITTLHTPSPVGLHLYCFFCFLFSLCFQPPTTRLISSFVSLYEHPSRASHVVISQARASSSPTPLPCRVIPHLIPPHEFCYLRDGCDHATAERSSPYFLRMGSRESLLFRRSRRKALPRFYLFPRWSNSSAQGG